jgi:predicted RecA/RadA family phage recombinase
MLNEAYTFYRPGKDITCKAAVDLTGKRVVQITANRSGGGITPTTSNTDLQSLYVVGAPTAGGRVFGVVGYDVKAGQVVPIKRDGVIACTASGAIAAFAEVEARTDGKIQTKASGAAIGVVLNGCADAADAELLLYN